MWEGQLQVQHGTNTRVGSWMLLGEASWPRHHWPQTFQTLWCWSTMPVGHFTTLHPCICNHFMLYFYNESFLSRVPPQPSLPTRSVPHVCIQTDFKSFFCLRLFIIYKWIFFKLFLVRYGQVCRTFSTIYSLLLANYFIHLAHDFKQFRLFRLVRSLGI